MDPSYGQTEDNFHKYLGCQHRLLDWTEAWLALLSGDGDKNLALANFLKLKKVLSQRPVKYPFIDLEAEHDNEEDELEDEEEYRPATVTHLPAHRHDLSEAITKIEVNATSGGSTSAPHPPYISRHYISTPYSAYQAISC
ncbi:hypothetical protein P692DRAFT_20884020 [Suillus brevipes Sb2]|nr:hypothetical protein P692DRAFT_20884020 [Suillus brevipes Sb2]